MRISTPILLSGLAWSANALPTSDTHTKFLQTRGTTGPVVDADAPYVDISGLYEAIWEVLLDMGKGRIFANPKGLNGWGNPLAWQRTFGATTVYFCDYGNGINIDAESVLQDMLALLDSDFQQNQGNEDLIKAAYYNHPDWKSSWGFTKKDTPVC